MSPFALLSLRRAWVFWPSLILLFVPCFKNAPSRVLIATEAAGPRRSFSAKLPLSFEPNLGQTDPQVKFLSRGPGYTLFLTEDEAALVLQKPEVRGQKREIRNQKSEARIRDSGFRIQEGRSKIQNEVVRLRLAEANPKAEVAGGDELPGKANYFIGNDPKKWRTNVPTYARVRYENVYPGVDLDFFGNQGGQLECDFVVAPGANPGRITLAVASDRQGEGRRQKAVGRRQSSVVSRQWSEVGHNGPRTADETGNSGHAISQSKIQNRKSKIASSLRIAPNGDLIVALPGGELRFHKPVVYQVQSTVDSRQSTVQNPKLREGTTGHGQLTSANPESEIQNPQLGERTTDHGQLTSANPKSKIQN